MNGVAEIQFWQFFITYILLVVVGIIMKKCHVDQIKLLVVASIRMSLQLMIAGLILTYIFKNPQPFFTLVYLLLMIGFAIYRVLSKNKDLNKKFKIVIGISISVSGLLIIFFFIRVVVGESIVNPQYVIPIGGMIMGNTMTGVTLGVKTFRESLKSQRVKINTLLNIGATPQKILLPFVCQALETSLLPTMNSMLGMGIVSLPGMMTGQILSGTLPTTSILYQITIMIAICSVVCLSSFGAVYYGSRTLINSKSQIML